MTLAADARALVGAAVSEFGRLDCAVNNAGINLPAAPMLEIDDEAWDRLFAVNVTGVRNCMRAELVHMLGAGKGAIVNMSSTLGLVGGRNCAAVRGEQTRAHRPHQGRRARLRASRASGSMRCVRPGRHAWPTSFWATTRRCSRRCASAMPIGRFIEADEVAAAAVWLCSPAASGLFGHAVTIDGAWTAV